MSKRDDTLMASLNIGTDSEVIRNPFSGKSCEVDAEGVALYDFIKGCEATQLYDKMEQALTLFRKLYPNEYYTLLD